MDALDVGIIGVGIAAAPLTKGLYIGSVQNSLNTLTPAAPGSINAQGVVATISTLGGLAAAWFGRNNDMVRYVGEFFTGYGVGVALDAPYNSNRITGPSMTGQAVTINRNVTPPRRSAAPASVGLKGANILI